MSTKTILIASALVFGCGAKDEPSETDSIELDEPASAGVEASPGVEPVEVVAALESECRLVDPPAGLVGLRVEIPSARIEAGYHRPDNFTGAPLPGYEAAGAWFDAEAATSLARVAKRLADAGHGLIIHDAYRPRRASEAMVTWAQAQGREDLLEQGWVAARSLHNRGLAIDLGLYRLVDGQPIDMGSAWDHFGSSSFLRGVEGAALEHRLHLRDAMIESGFEPYRREWWHFSWADSSGRRSYDEPYRCQP